MPFLCLPPRFLEGGPAPGPASTLGACVGLWGLAGSSGPVVGMAPAVGYTGSPQGQGQSQCPQEHCPCFSFPTAHLGLDQVFSVNLKSCVHSWPSRFGFSFFGITLGVGFNSNCIEVAEGNIMVLSPLFWSPLWTRFEGKHAKGKGLILLPVAWSTWLHQSPPCPRDLCRFLLSFHVTARRPIYFIWNPKKDKFIAKFAVHTFFTSEATRSNVTGSLCFSKWYICVWIREREPALVFTDLPTDREDKPTLRIHLLETPLEGHMCMRCLYGNIE